MSEITSEGLDELNKMADEQYALERLIDYIKNPEYTVMWKNGKGHYLLGDTVRYHDDELKVDVKGIIGVADAYIDLYNVNMEDIKIFKEIIDRHIHKQ